MCCQVVEDGTPCAALATRAFRLDFRPFPVFFRCSSHWESLLPTLRSREVPLEEALLEEVVRDVMLS